MMKEITVPAHTESIPIVTDWMDKVLADLGYAYPGKQGTVTVQLDHDAGTGVVCITFLDQGVPFDPLGKEEPDTTLGPEEREIGGLGIFLVRKIMDRAVYARRDGKNTLSLYKKIK